MSLILIVDDNNESRYLLEVLLERNGFETVTATNGKEALEIARVHRPDLIISDILMPVMDGFALCKQWMTDGELKRIPFVFYTATYTEPKDVAFGLSLGAVRFLIKPQEVEVLLQVFHEVLSESGAGTQTPSEPSFEEEMEFLRHHNEALFRKLEKKMADLEAANRSLQREVDKRRLTERSLRESERKLQKLLDTLQKAHDELEKRVAERTAELAQAYKTLEAEMAERAKSEEQLRQSQKMEAVGTLAGGVAHDFNNILMIITGNAELAMDDLPEEMAARHNLEQIFKAGMRGKSLVRQILTFSRKSEYERKPLPLIPLIKETFGLLRASLPTSIEMTLNIKTSADKVLADAVQIQQVLMNLCNNARDAMPVTGGRLEISLTDTLFSEDGPVPGLNMQPGTYVTLTVNDTGSGMDETVQKRLFEPFFTTKEKGQGTGLGLAVAYGIVKAHQGAITVSSTPGFGSTFTVYLPRYTSDEKTEPVTGRPVYRGKERILFVDDEEALVELAGGLLRSLGYQVVGITDSLDALQTFSEHPDAFDLAITDHIMPQMTGAVLAQKLKEIRPDIPLILCTGYSETISQKKAELVGIDGFVMKPLSRSELGETIRRVLDAKAEG